MRIYTVYHEDAIYMTTDPHPQDDRARPRPGFRTVLNANLNPESSGWVCKTPDQGLPSLRMDGLLTDALAYLQGDDSVLAGGS